MVFEKSRVRKKKIIQTRMKMESTGNITLKKKNDVYFKRQDVTARERGRKQLTTSAEQLYPTSCPDPVGGEGVHQLSLQFHWRH